MSLNKTNKIELQTEGPINKEEEIKKIEELKKKDGIEFYIYNVIKYVEYEKRKNYLLKIMDFI